MEAASLSLMRPEERRGESGRRVTNRTVSLVRVVRRGHLRPSRPPSFGSGSSVATAGSIRRRSPRDAPPGVGGTTLGHRTVAGGRIGRRPALAAALIGLVLAAAGLVPAIADQGSGRASSPAAGSTGGQSTGRRSAAAA